MKENKLVEYSIIFIAAVILVLVLQTLAGILRPLAIAFFITVLFIPEQSVVSCSTSEMISGQAVLTMVLVQVEDRPSAPVTVKA